MHEVASDIGYGIIFSIVGGAVGIVMVLLATLVVPKLVERMTPDLDEAKELARGNAAVGEYFGRIIAAAILGMSIIVAAAVLGGIFVATH
jgi:hypothetical protein